MKYSWKKIKRGLHKATTVWSVTITEPPALLLTYILANFFPFITPTCVTLFNLFVVIPLLFWFAINLSWKNLLLYGIFFEVAHILDNVDGILARATKRTSRTGAILDSLADRMANFSVVLISLGMYIWLRDNIYLILAFFTVYFRIMFIILDRILTKFYSSNIRIRRKSINEAKKILTTTFGYLPFLNKYKILKKRRYMYFNLMDVKMFSFSFLPIVFGIFKMKILLILMTFSFCPLMILVDVYRMIKMIK